MIHLLNEEITSDIHKQNLWKEHLDAHLDHRHNTLILWKTIHGLNRAPPTHTQHFHNIQQQNNNHTQKYCDLFHQTLHKHWETHNIQNKQSINRTTQKIQAYNIILTTTQVQDAIKQSKNNNSQGPDKLNIRSLKHIGPLGLAFLTLKMLLTTT